MIRNKQIGLITISIIMTVCLAFGLFMAFADASLYNSNNININTTDDDFAEMSSGGFGKSVDSSMVDGQVSGGSDAYLTRVYGKTDADINYNNVVVRISTTQELRDWLWKNPNQKSAILVGDILDFEWYAQEGWDSHLAPYLFQTDAFPAGINSGINRGVTLDGCGYTINLALPSGYITTPPPDAAYGYQAHSMFSMFASSLHGTIKNVNFTTTGYVHIKISNRHSYHNMTLAAGLLFADIKVTGVVENVNITHDTRFAVESVANDGLGVVQDYYTLHTGILAGATSGTIKQLTMDIKSNSVLENYGSTRGQGLAYAYSGYVTGYTTNTSVMSNLTFNIDKNGREMIKLHFDGGNSYGNSYFGMIAGKASGGKINGVLYKSGRLDLSTMGTYTEFRGFAFGLYSSGTLLNYFSNEGKFINSYLVQGSQAVRENSSYIYNDGNYNMTFDKASYTGGKLNNILITKNIPLADSEFIWGVAFQLGSNINTFVTYNQYHQSEITVPMLNARDINGASASNGLGYSMSIEAGKTVSGYTGWGSAEYKYDNTDKNIMFGINEVVDTDIATYPYDNKGAILDNISLKFSRKSVRNVCENITAKLMPVSSVYHNGEKILFVDKINKVIMLESDLAIGDGLVDTTSVTPATIQMTDNMFENSINAKTYDGYNLIDKKLFNETSVTSDNGIKLKLDILAVDKYTVFNDKIIINVDYVFDQIEYASGYTSDKVGSTDGVVMFVADNNYNYISQNGEILKPDSDNVIKINTVLPAIEKAEVSIKWDQFENMYFTGESFMPSATIVSGSYINKYADKANISITYYIDGVVASSIIHAGEYTAVATIDNDNFCIKIGDEKMTYTVGQPPINITCENGSVDKVYNDGVYTLKATANDGYVFSHWVNENGVIISQSNVLQTVSSSIVAVFAINPELSNDVLFYSKGGNILGKIVANNGVTFGDCKMVAPTVTGYEFIGWFYGDSVLLDSTIITDNISVNANYNRLDDNVCYSIGFVNLDNVSYTINGEKVLFESQIVCGALSGADNYKSSNIVSRVDVATDSLVTVSFVENNDNFLYWADAYNNILSYSIIYTFYANNSVVIRPIFDFNEHVITDEVSTINANVISNVGLDVIINGSFNIADGDTLLGFGVIVATNGSLSQSDMVVSNTNIDKYSLDLHNEFNQFASVFKSLNYGKHQFRAYMMVQDEKGNINVVYGKLNDFIVQALSVEEINQIDIFASKGDSLPCDVEYFGKKK